jgi:hypothetical protein
LNKEIHDTIELLKTTGIRGCITGSSMLDADFDTWAETPDVDVFVFSAEQLVYAIDMLEFKYGFRPLSDGEEWKIERIRWKGIQKNASLQTVKMVGPQEVCVNLTWKYGKTTLADVLASFDMTIIMKGYDIRNGYTLDLTDVCGNKRVASPNPMREQDCDMYGVEMWVRQFSRVIKYWNRGFDTRPMAQFYIELINGVLEKGQLFNTEKSENVYREFVETYEPLRDKMVQWLKAKEEAM